MCCLPFRRQRSRTGTAALAAVLALAIPLNSASADFGDVFFGTLKKGLVNTPLEDPLEMARYTAYEPEKAKVVYQRAVTGGYYTYVFFGLIAGVKAIKGKHFEGLGVFSYDSCMAPHTFVDMVFAKVDGYMDAAAAEVDLGGLGNELKAYAVDYGKAESAEAKDSLNEAINEKIPFWQDIPVICHFGFFTDFKHDKSLQATVWSTVDGIGQAYQNLAQAKLGDAIGGLLALGVNETMVCQLVDDAVAGGWMNKIPAVSKVGNTVCVGFTGFFINAGKWAGSVLEEIGAFTGVSNVGDWLAGQTQHVPPEQYYAVVWKSALWPALNERLKSPAFNFEAFATSLREECVRYFDSHTMSESTAAKVCDQHRDQFRAHYSDAALAMLAQKSLGEAVAAARNAGPAEYRTSNLWGAVSPDPTNSFRVVATPETVAALALTNLIPPTYDVKIAVNQAVQTMLPAMALARARALEQQAEQIAAAKAIQDSVKEQADAGEKAYIEPWLKRCGDDICRAEVLKKREACRQLILKAIADNPIDPDMPASQTKRQQAIAAVNASCEVEFNKYIEASAKRLLDDPNAGFSGTLEKLGCKNFLGRPKEQTCPTKAAFEACKSFVDKNQIRVCILLGAGSPPPKYVNKLMDDPNADPRIRAALWDCKNFLGRANQMLCPGDKGFGICKEAVNRGLMLECINSATQERYAAAGAPAGQPPPPPPPPVDTALQAQGCKFLLGRKGDWLCPTPAGYAACLTYLDQNKASACNAPGKPRRISFATLERQLAGGGCPRGQSRTGIGVVGHFYFACNGHPAAAACDKAKLDFARSDTVHCQVAVATLATPGGGTVIGPTGPGILLNPGAGAGIKLVTPGGSAGGMVALVRVPKLVTYSAGSGRNKIVGRFEKVDGVGWVENYHQSSPQRTLQFRFQEMEAVSGRIDLLDASRNMWVRLDLAAKRVLLSTDDRRNWKAVYGITGVK